jgi:hypothetical protein
MFDDFLGEQSGSSTFEKVQGKFKQVEKVDLLNWSVPNLYCKEGQAAPGYEDRCLSAPCNEAYCQKVMAVRPEDAVIDTCLKISPLSMLVDDVDLHCTTDEGFGYAVAAAGFLTTFDCYYGTEHTSGTIYARAGYYLQTRKLNLFEWMC